MDISIPANQKPLLYLSGRNHSAPLVAPWNSARDPYYGLGSHPDVVERLWKGLAPQLPMDCRFIICGTPALAHPTTGILLACAIGTQYALRLPLVLLPEATAAGLKRTTIWAGGEILDLCAEFGEDWVFGRFLPQENDWLMQAFRQFGGKCLFSV